ncbi:Myb/SANT-like DNA-binding domain 4 [Dillenia turbinata]|uniref:Myb/SANT-like DNA-binding domain 4 n=1 Tax=Dillenia turbinata TaxID=194707 RepID=A0AAN8VQM3_9MAGN
MERSINQENHPSLPPNNSTIKEESLRKPHGGGGGGGGGGSGGGGGGGGGGGDRLKRDEWSEGAVSSLLEAYEAKWVLRNRAKLKGHDWEDVAKHVSARAHSTKSPKTQTQCKNKIESMKKRYRSESATADASSWPLYPRLDLLLRGSAPAPSTTNPLLVLLEQPSPPPSQPPPPLPPVQPPVLMPPQKMPAPQSPTALPTLGNVQIMQESEVQRVAKEDGMETNKVFDHLSDKTPMETDSSTPALYSNKENKKSERTRMEKKGKRRREAFEVAESIRWLAEVVLRTEEARMETMRELEKMRIEAETKRGEMDLKRTEIIANTQLEIAKLFAANSGKGIDPSLRMGRS